MYLLFYFHFTKHSYFFFVAFFLSILSKIQRPKFFGLKRSSSVVSGFSVFFAFDTCGDL